MRMRVLSLCLSLAIGCNAGTESDEIDEPSNAVRPDAEAGGLKLLVFRNLPGDSGTKIDEQMNPSNEKIREAFTSIDWSATDQSNGITLTQPEPHIITLGLKQHSTHGLLMQFSERPPGQSKWSHQYAKLMTTEDALKAFLSFNSKDEDFRTMIDWKTEEEFCQ